MSSNLKTATAVFGGSFNPPTRAHLSVIEGASARFKEVIVMPTAISPFKVGAECISGRERIELLSKDCEGLNNVVFSDYELNKEGVSYTYLTLQHLSTLYENLYFVLGTDNISELHRWKNLEIINSLCTLYFVPRPYYTVTKEDIQTLDSLDCRYAIADFTGEEGSSTLVQVAVAFNKEQEVLTPALAEYVAKNQLFRQYCYITEKYKDYNLKQSRIDHIYGVVKSALILAKKNGVPTDKAIKASLYHDIGKYVTLGELKAQGVTLEQRAYEVPPSVAHAFVSEYIARAHFGETDEDVLNAIKNHTTGRSEMSTLECIVFSADFIEEGRNFDEVEEIRATVYEDLKKGMLKIVEHTLKYLKSKGAEIDGAMLDCRSWLKNTIGE